MKTLLQILSVFTLATFSINAIAQTEWAPVGAVWYYDYHGGWGEYESYVTMTSTGDTTIQGISCRKLDFKGPGVGPQFEYNTTYYTYESNDIVWLFDGSNFRLLYDFNAEAGNSWEAFSPSAIWQCDDSITNVVVDSIGYETINGVNLKYLMVNTPEPEWGFNNCYSYDETKILQKIGSLDFMFPQMTCGADMPMVCQLRCYEDNQIGFYSTGIADSCTYERGVGIKKIPYDDNISVFPNPVIDNTFIELQDISGNCTVKLMTPEGKTLFQKELTQKKSFIPMSHLPKGLYFLVFNINSTVSPRKVIKL